LPILAIVIVEVNKSELLVRLTIRNHWKYLYQQVETKISNSDNITIWYN